MTTNHPDGDSWASALDEAILAAADAMAAADDADWSQPAGDLDWDCRATVLHIASDFVGYATQLTAPRAHGYAAFDLVLEGTPGPAELRAVVRATGGLLSSVVRTADPGTRSWHPYGVAGPRDFAAMGIVELLVHTEDLRRGLGFRWAPPAQLSSCVLDHLFPHAPRDLEPWPTLLWATGRVALGERPRLQGWRWANTGS
jgi:Mycothiol maleylpyruvate isomerase N-terminal domain